MSTVGVTPVSPFKGLAAFEDSELDSLFFFGRERERQVLVANLLASRLTILYGESGVGKSSLLAAGVVRDLRTGAPGTVVSLLDTWSDRVGDEVLADIRAAPEPYLILDQFEEYFLYHGDADEPGTLLYELPNLLHEARVNVLISLREESLARLDAFKARIPAVFGNQVRLEHLDRSEARAAILGPIGRWNELTGESVEVGPHLVDAVVDEVAVEGRSRDRSRIEAPYLQLVLERIWEAERAAGSAVLRVETLHALGGAGTIVRDHLDRALATLDPGQQDVAASMFEHLVTPSGTKIAHRAPDLAQYADVPEDMLRGVLTKLTRDRIVHSVDGSDRYEIFHDVLAEPIRAWRRAFVTEAALERERRAATKRHRRLLYITVGAAVLAAVMVALAVFAFTQRNQAAKQQTKAERAAKIALVDAARARKAQKQEQAAEATAEQQRKAAQTSAAEANASAERARQATARANAANAAAQQSAEEANAARVRADRNKKQALHEAAVARSAVKREASQAAHARARALAEQARALLLVDPVKSVRLALDALQLEPSTLTEDALRASVVADRLRAVVPGGGGPVRSAAFSPDGSRILTLADGGGARLSQANGKLVRRLGSGRTLDAAFSPDGSVAATADAGGVHLWNAKDGATMRTLSSTGVVAALSGAAETVAFSGDGKRVAAGGPGGAIVWSSDGAVLASFPHDGRVTSVMLDGVGGRLVTVATDSALHQQARIFDIATDPLERLLPERGITSATFSPDGAWVATTSNDKTARLWDVTTGSQHASMSSDGHLLDSEFSRSGKLLVAANEAGGAVVWRVPDMARQAQILGPLNKVETASFSPDGQFVAISSLDRTASVFRSSDGFRVALLSGNHGGVFDAQWAPDGANVVTAGEDGSARVWDPGTKPLLGLVGRHAAAVNTLHLSPDGRLAVTAGADKTARIWQLAAGDRSIVLQHDGTVEDAVFSPDASLVLTGSDDGTARLWRASTGAPVQVLRAGAPVTAVAFAPDGRMVATAAADGTAALWRVVDGSRAHVLSSGDAQPLRAVVFSPDGSLVATAGDDRMVHIWNTTTGTQFRVLRGHADTIATVAFSSDGQRLVTASADHTARLWSVPSATLIATLAGHTDAVNDAEFSSDGGRIVTASADSDGRLWNGKTGKLVSVLRGHFGSVQTASFSPNGRWIVTGGPFTVGLWRAATGLLFSPTGSSDPYLRGPTLAVDGASFAHDGMTIVAASADGSVRRYRCAVCGGLGELKQLARALLSASASGLSG